MTVRSKDVAERVLWTFVVAALTNLVSITFLDIEAWKGAVMAGLAAAINAVIAVARWRLSVLPDPGAAVAQAARAQAIADVAALPPEKKAAKKSPAKRKVPAKR